MRLDTTWSTPLTPPLQNSRHASAVHSTTARTASLALLSGYLILKPFYLWNSGLPQLSDFLMMAVFVCQALKHRFVLPTPVLRSSFVKATALFSAWTLFANSVAALILNDASFVPAALFYLYNGIAAIVVYGMYLEYRQDLLRHVYVGITASVMLQTVLLSLNRPSIGLRATGSFNNPNQLAYFGLLCAATLLFLSTRIDVNAIMLAATLGFAALIVAASLSKAGMVSFVALVLLYLLQHGRTNTATRRVSLILLLLIGVVLLVPSLGTAVQQTPTYESIESRFLDVQSDDNVASRGYSRIVEFPAYWLLGAGEGQYFRFGSDIEFHSTLGNIQVSYGLIGTLLFLAVLLRSLQPAGYRDSYLVIALMLHGLSHNGIRNTILWILLALLASATTTLSNRTQSVPSRRPTLGRR